MLDYEEVINHTDSNTHDNAILNMPSTDTAETIKTIEDDHVCAICLDGDVYDENEIIFCDKCNVPVHQFCYNINVVPAGEWFCDCCAAGANPETTACELCSNTGGALKPTDKAGKWAHSLCAIWIPEVFTLKVRGVNVLTIASLDKKRFRLKCQLCNSKGACIQCCYGRCTMAAHPYCVLHRPQGFTKRVIKNEEGNLVWEIFCKQHASAVTEPLKSKPKSKAQESSAYIEQEEERIEFIPSKSRKSDQVSNRVVNKVSMAHACKYDISLLKIRHDPLSPDILITSSSSKKNVSISLNGQLNYSEVDNDGNSITRKNSETAAKAKTDEQTNLIPTSSSYSSSSTSFPVLTMSEWPGQSEGEAMDLDHFWNVVSMSFPEDHSREWVDFMTRELLNEVESLLEAASFSYKLGPKVIAPPPRGQLAQLTEELEEKLGNVGNDRERLAMFDPDKRSSFLLNAQSRAQILRKSTAHLQGMNFDDLKNKTTFQDSTSDSEPIPNLVPTAAQLLAYQRQDDSVHFLRKHLKTPEEFIDPFNRDGCATLTAAFDSSKRIGAHFEVRVDLTDDEKEGQLTYNLDELKQGRWEVVDVSPSSERRYVVDASAKDLLISALPLPEKVSQQSSPTDLVTKVAVRLDNIALLDDSSPVYLADAIVSPKSEDDTFARMIRTNQSVLQDLSTALADKIRLLQNLQLGELAFAHNIRRQEWSDLESGYQKQHVWRRVAGGIIKGMRDQVQGFNKAAPEILPASWKIRVEGRPVPKTDETTEEKEDEQEDAVCMACFDGTSNDNNKILFCDGCNAALHQICYGIAEIPEGDFFCDRCRVVQSLAADESLFDFSPKDGVKCCLCPLHHGGIKPTTDGRWVHLCCAFWSKESVLTDLAEMGPIDVTKVPVQFPEDICDGIVTNRQRTALSTASVHSQTYQEFLNFYLECEIFESCGLCDVRGGFVTTCSGSDSSTGTPCKFVCHPICAWFAGFHFETLLIDPSFQGVDRNGLFPSGISYSIVCNQHQPQALSVDFSSTSYQQNAEAMKTLRYQEQRIIREKYRINEFDLEHIPGKGGRRRKKKNKPKLVPASRSDRAAQTNRIKELAKDTYDETKCACCLVPFDLSLFQVDTAAASASLNASGTTSAIQKTGDAILEATELAISLPLSDPSQASAFPLREEKFLAFEQLEKMYEMLCVECNTIRTQLPVIVPTPSSPNKLISEDLVDSNSHDELKHLYGTEIRDVADREYAPSKYGISDHSLLKSEYVTKDPLTTLSRAVCTSVVSDPLMELQVYGSPETNSPQSNSAPSTSPSKCRPDSTDTPDALQAKVQPDSSQSGSKLYLPDTIVGNTTSDGAPKECDSIFVETVDTAGNEFQAAVESKSIDSLPPTITCAKCHVKVHTTCLFPTLASLNIEDQNLSDYLCPPCLIDDNDPRCYFCPRRGGSYRRTRGGNWIHQFCALHSVGHNKIHTDGVVEIGTVPKENKKHTCFVCNRKEGVFNRCSSLGCTTYFHALCGERSSKAYSFIRLGDMAQFCQEHIPEGVEKHPSGYWVVESELGRFRYVLDRSRLIVDMLTRRDKIKRLLAKAEGDIFQKRLYKTLDRARGRKHSTLPLAYGLSHQGDGVESDSDDESDGESEAITVTGSPEPMKAKVKPKRNVMWLDLPPGPDMDITTSGGIPVRISGSYIRDNKVKIPLHTKVSFSGVEIGKRDSDYKFEVFQTKTREVIDKNLAALLRVGAAFVNYKESVDFANELKESLLILISWPDKRFCAEVEKLNRRLPEKDRVDMSFMQQLIDSKTAVTGKRARKPDVGPEQLPPSSSKVSKLSKKKPEVILVEAQEPLKKAKSHHDFTSNLIEDEAVVEIVASRDLKKKKSLKVEHIDPAPKSVKVIKTDANGLKLSAAATISPRKSASSSYSGIPPSAFISVSAAEKELNTDPLFTSLFQSCNGNLYIDFSVIYSLSGLNDIENRSTLADDWAITESDEARIRLEARLMDILNEIDVYEVPIGPLNSQCQSLGNTADSTGTGRASNRKKLKPEVFGFESSEVNQGVVTSCIHKESKNSSPKKPLRFLVGEFTEIPDENMPDYDRYVRRRMTIETIRRKVQMHYYRSIASFSKDFYEILNNGIYATRADSSICADAEALAILFESVKVRSVYPDTKATRTAGQTRYVARFSKKTKTSNAIFEKCRECSHQYELEGWPEDAPRTLPSDRSKRDSWHWLCPNCLIAHPNEVINRKIQVWWNDDHKYYPGIIKAFDETSRRHCILYEDDEWEYINISVEPILLANPLTLASSDANSANSNCLASRNPVKNNFKTEIERKVHVSTTIKSNQSSSVSISNDEILRKSPRRR